MDKGKSPLKQEIVQEEETMTQDEAINLMAKFLQTSLRRGAIINFDEAEKLNNAVSVFKPETKEKLYTENESINMMADFLVLSLRRGAFHDFNEAASIKKAMDVFKQKK